jgi:hypothetical protein
MESFIESFVRGLIALAERLQQGQRWAILHRLTECSRVLRGLNLYSCTLLSPHCLSRNLHGPYFCMRTMDWPNTPVLLHSRDRCWGIFLNLCRHNPCRGILNGQYLPHRCERILVGRPSQKLPNQGFRRARYFPSDFHRLIQRAQLDCVPVRPLRPAAKLEHPYQVESLMPL